MEHSESKAHTFLKLTLWTVERWIRRRNFTTEVDKKNWQDIIRPNVVNTDGTRGIIETLDNHYVS